MILLIKKSHKILLNLSLKILQLKTVILSLCIIIFIQGCFLPFIGGKKEKNDEISVFDTKKFLEIREYDFPEYKWTNNPWVWVIEFKKINTD